MMLRDHALDVTGREEEGSDNVIDWECERSRFQRYFRSKKLKKQLSEMIRKGLPGGAFSSVLTWLEMGRMLSWSSRKIANR